jgi:hypothetical protein
MDEVACCLGISDQEIDGHLAILFARMGAANRSEAVAAAGRRGLLDSALDPDRLPRLSRCVSRRIARASSAIAASTIALRVRRVVRSGQPVAEHEGLPPATPPDIAALKRVSERYCAEIVGPPMTPAAPTIPGTVSE